MRARAVGWIAANELRRLGNDRTMLFFGVLLPLVIITLIGTAFGSLGAVEIGVLDEDGTPASRRLVERLDSIDGVELEAYDSLDALRRDVRLGSLQAGVRLDGGYGASLAASAAQLTVVVDLGSPGSGPAIAAVEGAAAEEGVRAAAIQAVDEGLDERDATAAVDEAADSLAAVEVRTDTAPDEGATVGSFSYTAPANLVLFVFINTFAVGSALATDRRLGLVRRLLSTPHRVGTVAAGIGAAKGAFALAQSALIVGIGSLFFDVSWGDPIAATVLVVVFAVLATAVGLLVGSVATDAEQAQAIGIPVAVGMGMLGGCMWPLGLVPDAMRAAGHLVPHAWAMDAWTELVFDGASVGDIALELGVLVAFAVAIGLMATGRLRAAIAG